MRALITAIVAALVSAAVASGAAKPGFSLGVTAGEVTSSSALLWTRADAPGSIAAEVASDAAFTHVVFRATVVPRAAGDVTLQVAATGLAPATRYVYRFRQGATTSPVGRFETAPPAAANASVRFAFSGDEDATPARGGTAPAFGPYAVFARMAGEGNDFNINLGDTIYSDSEVPGTPVARTVPEKWAHYRAGLELPAMRAVRAATGLYSHWDDHEFVNDFSVPEFGKALYAAGVKTFTDYAPVTWTAQDGLYRTFRWGKNLELFFLDERSFRSAKASAGGVCDSAPGVPDLAPTAPDAVRGAFAALVPALAKPVPAACAARLADPSRTFLGARQLARFEAAIRASTATWKVVVNEDPISQFYANPYDRWEGYPVEREKLLAYLHANVSNAVFLTTDTHANLVGPVRSNTLDPGGPVDSGVFESVTGPVATNTFTKEIDGAIGASGVGIVITQLFLKPAPPKGVGFQCAATDVYSYDEVSVTATTLTITPKDAAGRPVLEANGSRCGPFVLTTG